ncbi:MAG: serine hydrolase [Ruminococcaceae bacterium]|nr:serine hydrolase [Oscillospiraceae bacterium]
MIPVEELTRLCKEVEGECGLYVSVPETGERFVWNENYQVYSASTIKIPVLCLLFQDAEQGRVDLAQKVVVKPENRVGGSGILQSLRPDLEMSIFDLATLMMVMSDNIATNQIIDIVGMERVRDFCKEEGLDSTWIWQKMIHKGPPPADMPEGLIPNATTAADLGVLMEKIAAGTIVSPVSCQKVMQIMAGQRLGRLQALLPTTERLNPYADCLRPPAAGKIVVASKGGSKESAGAVHDTGIFILPDGRRYVMAVCTKTPNKAKAVHLIQQMGLAMYNAMK